MAKLHPMLEPFELPIPHEEPFSALMAAHLLNRAGFGGTGEEIARVVKIGPAAAVAELLDFPDAPAEEISQTEVPDLSKIDGYPKTFADRRKLYANKTAEERQLIQQRLNQANQQALRQVAKWWVERMAAGPYPLHEKLVLFWHGHFTTSARDERSAWLMWGQNETWRTHAAGNFGHFVKAVSRDPAMLDYLNNQQNRKKSPNENYARELMELFTLGIGNYTETDVKEGARAFTGWAHDGENFIFRKYDHDDGEKTFLGRRGVLDGDDVIDVILSGKTCANYIASRLWTFFVSDEPDPAVIASLGDLLRESNYELRPVLRTLFRSKAFFDKAHVGTQIKSPVQMVVGTIRNLGVTPPDFNRVHNALEQMGQVPLMPPNVKGWPGGRTWINTSTMFVRYNTALWLAGGQPPKGRKKKGGGIDVNVQGTPEAIVDAWVARLIQRPIADSRKAVLIREVGTTPTEQSVRSMVNLVLSMPEYQLC